MILYDCRPDCSAKYRIRRPVYGQAMFPFAATPFFDSQEFSFGIVVSPCHLKFGWDWLGVIAWHTFLYLGECVSSRPGWVVLLIKLCW